MKSFMLCISDKYYSGDEIKNTEMGMACSMYEESSIKCFGGDI